MHWNVEFSVKPAEQRVSHFPGPFCEHPVTQYASHAEQTRLVVPLHAVVSTWFEVQFVQAMHLKFPAVEFTKKPDMHVLSHFPAPRVVQPPAQFMSHAEHTRLFVPLHAVVSTWFEVQAELHATHKDELT
jgi:hypothetical protein